MAILPGDFTKPQKRFIKWLAVVLLGIAIFFGIVGMVDMFFLFMIAAIVTIMTLWLQKYGSRIHKS